MQRQFCHCGHMVIVNYIEKTGWRPLFITEQSSAVKQKMSITTCPSCGSKHRQVTLRKFFLCKKSFLLIHTNKKNKKNNSSLAIICTLYYQFFRL